MTRRTSNQSPLPRRTFLKGVGTAMALPALEAMRPASLLAAESAGEPVRMAFVFFPNGAIMPDWKPTGEGTDYQLSKTLKPLEKLKSEINVFTGLAQDNGRAKGDGPGDHARCASTFITGAHPFKTAGADIRVGISADQLAAQQIGKKTKLPSLELGIERGRTAGNCDSGYSCAYSSAVSWKSPTTPMAKEVNPQLVFERLFGTDGESAKERLRRAKYRKSILDLVAADATKLRKKLGQTDRRKIDEFFTCVRELEVRIEQAAKEEEQKRPGIDPPSGIPGDYQEHIRLMYDLMTVAFRTDSTRIATFMVGNAGSNRAYRMVGVNSGWHSISHHRNEKDKVRDLQKIDQYLVEQFAYFLEKLRSVKEGSRTLLDNSMIVYGSGLGDGNRHNHADLPVVLAGRGGGTIKTGRHFKMSDETPLNNLLVSMIDRVGAKVDKFGDSNGRLKVIDA